MTDLSAASLHASNQLLVVLARSARTDFDDAGMVSGHLDPPLHHAGVMQARLLGTAVRAVLSPIRPLRVVHSPLLRAAQTAQAIVNAMPLPPQVTCHQGLIDRYYGPWEGHAVPDNTTLNGALDGGAGLETQDHVLRRTYEVLDTLSTGPVVVVTHDANIDVLLAALGCLPHAVEHTPPATAGCHLLVRGSTGWELHGSARRQRDLPPALSSTLFSPR
ncbi:histidine phosphatase family protein [Allobranchiibius sp. GilTou73]|uniref:histidine phosphatase family protein n=1 Tax=Allobranchiibius sp. GilTou73 TaxID=2904523 RepID=UPI001F26AC90|nr:histidine phosphatase family protein [Allobranchiibius sp. GilTou73]UIJ33735.1 histidine phosphatase family protein [Allobranchiibius sp. GilTou73]